MIFHRVVIGVFILTVLLAVLILVDETSRNTISLFRELLVNAYSVLVSSSQVSSVLSAWAGKGIEFFSANKDLLLYGGIALFGMLMVGSIIRNIKEIFRQENHKQSLMKDLVVAKEKAESLSRLKAEFLNYVSHELRTPVAVIMGYIDCLADGLYGHIDSSHKQILETVSRQSDELRKMIDRILAFSRLEADKHQVKVEEVSVHKMVDKLRDTCDFLAHKKGIEILWELPTIEVLLKTDSEGLREILSNLVQNAIKYTNHGSVCVRVQPLAATDSVELEVTDTGIGIPRDALTAIFDPFVRVHKTGSQGSPGGFGLGLSIVKNHVERLKGKIFVESKLGQGTTFRVVLPKSYLEENEIRKGPVPFTRIARDRVQRCHNLASSPPPAVPFVEETGRRSLMPRHRSGGS